MTSASLGVPGIHMIIVLRLELGLKGPQFGQGAEDCVPSVSFDSLFLKSKAVPGSLAGKTSAEWGRYEIITRSVNRRWSDPRLPYMRQRGPYVRLN